MRQLKDLMKEQFEQCLSLESEFKMELKILEELYDKAGTKEQRNLFNERFSRYLTKPAVKSTIKNWRVYE
jgi:hypothetical protein